MTINEIYLLLFALILVPGILAQILVRGALKKYSQVRARSGRTGAEAAGEIMADAGIHDVQIERTNSFLATTTIRERRRSRCRPTFTTASLLPLWALRRTKQGMPFSTSTPMRRCRRGWLLCP
jgi:Zn-dependent membrane protease YugP